MHSLERVFLTKSCFYSPHTKSVGLVTIGEGQTVSPVNDHESLIGAYLTPSTMTNKLPLSFACWIIVYMSTKLSKMLAQLATAAASICSKTMCSVLGK